MCRIAEGPQKIPEEQPCVLGFFSMFSIGILYPVPWEMRALHLSKHSQFYPQWHRPRSTQHFHEGPLFPTLAAPPHHTGPGHTWCHSKNHHQNIKHVSTLAICAIWKSHSAEDLGLGTSSPSVMSTTKNTWNCSKLYKPSAGSSHLHELHHEHFASLWQFHMEKTQSWI